MFKAVIFDLNGVFIQSQKLSERFREQFGVPEDKFLPALKDVMNKARMPNAGDSFAYWKSYLESWNIQMSREEFFDFWFSTEKEVPKMIELAKELKIKGIKIFILSNNFKERTEYYSEHFPFLIEIADKIYYSWQTGFRKDNIKAYQKVLADNKLIPEECIYFDDSKENIELASSLGIKACLFEGFDKTKESLGSQ